LPKQFAAELKSQFAPADMVARLGGDEFIVVSDGNTASGLLAITKSTPETGR